VHLELVAAAGDKDVWAVGGGELWVQFGPVTLGAGSPLLPRRLELRLEETLRNRDFACARYTSCVHPGMAS
jgi:hypothetical protein